MPDAHQVEAAGTKPGHAHLHAGVASGQGVRQHQQDDRVEDPDDHEHRPGSPRGRRGEPASLRFLALNGRIRHDAAILSRHFTVATFGREQSRELTRDTA